MARLGERGAWARARAGMGPRHRPPATGRIQGGGRWVRAADDGGTSITVVTGSDPGPEVLRTWDALVDRTPGTDVTQFSTWARLRTLVGFAPVYVMAFRGEELVGGAQILSRRLPVLGRVGYLPYGPLIAATGAGRDEVRAELTAALARLCRGTLRMLFVQPPEGAEDVSAELLGHGFRPSSAGIAPAGSIRIDLTADLTEIRSRFGRRLRSWPNRWASRGVTVREGDERDVPLLAELMKSSALRQGYQPLPEDYITMLYRELAATGHAALFVGEVNGVPVAADLVTRCGGMLRGRLSGFDRSGEAARLSVPAAIRWQILQWGKERGYQWLDFGGLREQSLRALLDGTGTGTATGGETELHPADQPKTTFGGRAFRYPTAVELVRPVPLRLAYDLAWRTSVGQRLMDTAKRLLRGAGGAAQQPEPGDKASAGTGR